MALPSNMTMPPPAMMPEETDSVRESITEEGVKFMSENIDKILTPEHMQSVCNEALRVYIDSHLQHAIMAEMGQKMRPMVEKIISDNNLILGHGIDFEALIGNVIADAVNRMQTPHHTHDSRQMEMDVGRSARETRLYASQCASRPISADKAGQSLAGSMNDKISKAFENMLGKVK